eukprot:708244-Pyramimonas_sp.AAC.1
MEANVSSDAFKTTIKPWLDETQIDEGQWSVVGPSPARRFVLQFSGDINAATRRAAKARKALKQTDGTWRTFQTTTIEQGVSRVFIGCDRAPKQIRTEIQT